MKTLALALLTFFILSQIVIFSVNREPWFDVSFTLQTVNKLRTQGIGSIDWPHYDTHPPTNYYTYYFWSYVPHGNISDYHWLQELPVFFTLIFLTFAYFGLKIFFGRSGEKAIMLLALCTTYLHYGTEVRMYALVLALSAITFYCVAKGLKGRYAVIAGICLFMMPLTHYFAMMATFFNAFFAWMVAKKRGDKIMGKNVKWIFIAGMIGTAIAGFTFALPQRARVEGTWFQSPTVADWPSAIFYAFFMTEQMPMAPVYLVLYLVTILLMIVVVVKGYRLIRDSLTKEGPISERRLVLTVMGLSMFFPLAGIVGAPLLGGQGFAHLYHHRFFLVVVWMFAAMVFVMFFDVIDKWLEAKLKLIRGIAKISVIVLVVVLMLMFLNYCVYAHHELSNLMQQTPCTKERIQIAHESPFSALPYDYYARENGCNWWNFVSTNLTQRMLNGGGGDIMKLGSIFYNRTLPKGDYYYVYSEGTVPVDGSPEKVASEDGVWLWYVKRSGFEAENWTMKSQYEYGKQYQYMAVSWVNNQTGEIRNVPVVPING